MRMRTPSMQAHAEYAQAHADGAYPNAEHS